MNVMRYASEEAAKTAAGRALDALFAEAKNRAILFLASGGSAFDILSEVRKDRLGPRVTVGVLDERYARDAQANNFAQLQATDFYLAAVLAGARVIESAPRESESLHAFAGRMEEAWRTWRKENEDGRIVITQGIGLDGHTAGVMPFPEDPARFAALFEDERRYVTGYDAGGKNPYPLRATATLSFLKNEVDASVVYAAGAGKTAALERVCADLGTLAETPARVIHTMKNAQVYALDTPTI